MNEHGPVVYAGPQEPTGICYRMVMWEAGALPESSLAEWQSARKDLLAAMRDAGIKGSRGKLAGLEKELRELNCRVIEGPLATCPRRALTCTRANALAAFLAREAGVLGFRLGACSVEVLLQAGEDCDPQIKQESWKQSVEGMEWSAESLCEALMPADAARMLAEYRAADTLHASAAEDEAAAALESTPFRHVTVLAHEAVDALQPAEGRVLVDATLGGGGHSELMLQAGAEVWGIDQDPAARAAAKRRLAAYGDKLHVVAGNFRNAVALLQERGVQAVDGLLADIGISSPQVDCAERGFSFLNEGPLDMRMNPAAERSAADIVNTAAESELADILWQYGEERASRAIARRIVQERSKAPITTTTQLADIIATVLPRKGKQHPATRSFQALRIAVNDELGALEDLLHTGLSLLRSGGRFAVITFHSLEDRAVKRFFEQVTRPEIDRPEWPAPRPNPDYAAKLVFRKPITASEAELSANPRSRSAKLRVIEKL